MDLSLSPTEDRPTKKRPYQSIRRRIAAEVKVSWPAILDMIFQRRTAAAVAAGSRHGEGQNVGISTKRK